VVRVLIVDDDRKFLPLLEPGFRYEGFEVATALTGAEGIELVRHFGPDVVILDIGMPAMDGFEVLRRLRRLSDVPVVMLTARDEITDKVNALGLGADDYVASRSRSTSWSRGSAPCCSTASSGTSPNGPRRSAPRRRPISTCSPPPTCSSRSSTPAGVRCTAPETSAGRVLPTPAEATAGRVVEVRVDQRPLFLTAAPLRDGGQVVVARSPVTVYGALRQLRRLLTIVDVIALGVTATLAWLFAALTLRPVSRVTGAAERVLASRDMSQRVAHRGPPDEIGRLAATFNAMLAELDAAYESLGRSNVRLRQFLADCAHELRAPLTLLRSNVDLIAKVGETDPQFRTQALADIRAAAERMARMITQLLILARADSGTPMQQEPVCLREVVEAACRDEERMADDVRFDPGRHDELEGAVLRGSPDHLRQALPILLDNAVKYTPAGGEVRVQCSTADGWARVSVTDTGSASPHRTCRTCSTASTAAAAPTARPAPVWGSRSRSGSPSSTAVGSRSRAHPPTAPASPCCYPSGIPRRSADLQRIFRHQPRVPSSLSVTLQEGAKRTRLRVVLTPHVGPWRARIRNASGCCREKRMLRSSLAVRATATAAASAGLVATGFLAADAVAGAAAKTTAATVNRRPLCDHLSFNLPGSLGGKVTIPVTTWPPIPTSHPFGWSPYSAGRRSAQR